jgi:hypothetical protein
MPTLDPIRGYDNMSESCVSLTGEMEALKSHAEDGGFSIRRGVEV